MRAAHAKVPATVVTGFLGAGKTTLVRHLLATARGRRLALIVNEFGDVGIDGEILRACGVPGCPEEAIVELANGCICCTVADDFLPTMRLLLARTPPPDHIVIETSGLALPKPLVGAFNWPEVRTRATVDGVIAVIDGPAVADGNFATDPARLARQRAADAALDHESPLEELFADQLACADLAVLNKTDLVAPAVLGAVEARVRRGLRPGAKLVRARHGALDAAIVLGIGAGAEDDLAQRPSHHDADDDHDHDAFESFCLRFESIPDAAVVAERLRPLARDHDILRVKGFVSVVGRSMRLVVQGVGTRIQHYFDRDWRDGEDRSSRLVVIGIKGLDRVAIARAIGGPACTF